MPYGLLVESSPSYEHCLKHLIKILILEIEDIEYLLAQKSGV